MLAERVKVACGTPRLRGTGSENLCFKKHAYMRGHCLIVF